MSREFGTIVTMSAEKQIANALRQAILDGRIQVDERLPTEDELATQFGVSRPTIREAVKRLAAENLIRSRRGPAGGNFVRKPTQQEVKTSLANSTRLLVSLGEFEHDEIAEARLQLESVCCAVACRNRRKSDLAIMAREIEIQRDRSVSDVDFCASDVRFHTAIAEATRNPLLALLVTAVLESLQPITNLIVFRFRDRSLIASQHDRILAAITEGDAASAEQAIAEQIQYLRKKYGEARAWRKGKDQQESREGRVRVRSAD